jgi:hypothetical protein
MLGRGHVEHGLGPFGEVHLEVVQLVDEDSGWLGVLVHDVRVRSLAVDWRCVGLGDRLVVEGDPDAVDRAARGDGSLLGGACRVADQRPQRGTRDEQRSRDDEEEAQDCGARVAEEPPEDQVEGLPRAASVRLAENRHDAQREEDEAGAERAHVDELGPRDEQAAHGHQDERNPNSACADEGVEAGVDPVADVAAVPSEPERNGEEDAQEEQAEPEKLVMLLRAGALRPRALLLAHTGRGLRT